jgi:competence protein ComEA
MLKKILAVVAMMYAALSFAAVDVNKASAADLDGIKGIGPGISTKILDERKKGSFKDWNDFIERVKGVGEGNASKFSADGLTVNGAGFKGAPAAPAAKADAKAAAPVAKAAPAAAAVPAAAAPAAAPAPAAKADAKADAKAAKAAAKAQKAEESKAKKEAAAQAKADKKAAKAGKADKAVAPAAAASAAKK